MLPPIECTTFWRGMPSGKQGLSLSCWRIWPNLCTIQNQWQQLDHAFLTLASACVCISCGSWGKDICIWRIYCRQWWYWRVWHCCRQVDDAQSQITKAAPVLSSLLQWWTCLYVNPGVHRDITSERSEDYHNTPVPWCSKTLCKW